MKIGEDSVQAVKMSNQGSIHPGFIVLMFLIVVVTVFLKSGADRIFENSVSECTASKPFSERQCRIFLRLSANEQTLVEEVLAMPNFKLNNPEAKNQ